MNCAGLLMGHTLHLIGSGTFGLPRVTERSNGELLEALIRDGRPTADRFFSSKAVIATGFYA
jgi:hypothetical protein